MRPFFMVAARSVADRPSQPAAGRGAAARKLRLGGIGRCDILDSRTSSTAHAPPAHAGRPLAAALRRRRAGPRDGADRSGAARDDRAAAVAQGRSDAADRGRQAGTAARLRPGPAARPAVGALGRGLRRRAARGGRGAAGRRTAAGRFRPAAGGTGRIRVVGRVRAGGRGEDRGRHRDVARPHAARRRRRMGAARTADLHLGAVRRGACQLGHQSVRPRRLCAGAVAGRAGRCGR